MIELADVSGPDAGGEFGYNQRWWQASFLPIQLGASILIKASYDDSLFPFSILAPVWYNTEIGPRVIARELRLASPVIA